MRKTAGEDKMSGFGSKFHMNAFPFSGHYDGNGPYHSICFALELSLVIYVPRGQIYHVTIQYKQCFCHTARGGAEYERFVYICGRVCGWVMRHLWQCQCVTAGPPTRERRLERLPSRVAFVW